MHNLKLKLLLDPEAELQEEKHRARRGLRGEARVDRARAVADAAEGRLEQCLRLPVGRRDVEVDFSTFPRRDHLL